MLFILIEFFPFISTSLDELHLLSEKQIQNWSHSKKEGLILNKKNLLHELASCKNASHFKNKPNSSSKHKKND